jgi:tetratricopeptide (TPR) repeat protein
MALLSVGAGSAVSNDFAQLVREAEQLCRQGDYARAEPILLAALNEADRFGPDDPRRAIVWNNLGSVYHFMNKYPQAERCYRHAVEIEEKLWSGSDERPTRSILNLAALYIETGRYGKAERLGLRSIADHQTASQRTHSDYARLLVLLGDLEWRQGKYSSALEYTERAVAIFEHLPPDGSQIAETLNSLCVLYGQTGCNADALSSCYRALSIGEAGSGLEPSLQASLLANTGTFEFLAGRPADAESLYKRALTVAEDKLGRGHPLLARILLSYAVVLEHTSRKSEAKECRRRAKAILATASTADQGRYTVDLDDLLRKSPRH